MQRDDVTERDMARVLRHLAIAFGRQKEHDGESATDAVRIYRYALRGVPLSALESGMTAVIEEDRYFPRPARLRAAALRFVPRVAPSNAGPSDGPLVCGVGHRLEVRSYTNANGRLVGDRWYCPCEDRAAELYGVTWGEASGTRRERAA